MELGEMYIGWLITDLVCIMFSGIEKQMGVSRMEES